MSRRDVDMGGGLMLNWWVHLFDLAWSMGEVEDAWDCMERAFEDLKSQDNLT